MKNLQLLLLIVAGLLGHLLSLPEAQAQQSRFVMGGNTWARDPDTGLARRRSFNNVAPLAMQHVPSGRTVSVQSMTGVDFAKLPKQTKNTAVASGRLTAPVNPVASDPSVFGKPNAPAQATANSIRPGLPMTASPILATLQTKQFTAKSVSKPIRSVSGKRVEKLPVALNYPHGAGFVSGPTAPTTFISKGKTTTSTDIRLLPRH